MINSPDYLNNSHPGEDPRRLLCPRSIFTISLLQKAETGGLWLSFGAAYPILRSKGTRGAQAKDGGDSDKS